MGNSKKPVTVALALVWGALLVVGSTYSAYSSHSEGDGGAGNPAVSSATSSTSSGTVQASSSTVQVSSSAGQGSSSSVSSSTVSSSNSSDSGNVVNGSGKRKSEARSVRGFNQVAVNGIGQLVLTQGGQDSLTIEGDQNILPTIRSDVDGRVLHLGIKEGTTIRPSVPIVYRLTMRDIAGIQQTGLANIESESIQSDILHLSVGGPGSIKIGQLHAHSLAVALSGSGSMRLAGDVGDQRVQIVGAGDYRADQLWSQDAQVAIQGSANCAVRVAGTLAASIVGAGTITYAGAPSITRQIVGVGTVTPA